MVGELHPKHNFTAIDRALQLGGVPRDQPCSERALQTWGAGAKLNRKALGEWPR
jgi:hypothetical protein